MDLEEELQDASSMVVEGDIDIPIAHRRFIGLVVVCYGERQGGRKGRNAT